MKKIMIATDGSQYSRDAAAFVARIPHQQPLEITVASVVNTPRIYTDGSQVQWLGDYVAELKQQAARGFDEITAVLEGADVRLRHEMIEGPVGPALVETAKKVEADLVVLGARGHSNVERILLGSISDYVATHAHASVLVVRPSAADDDQRLQIAIGFEDSAPARAAIEEIAEIQWGNQSHLHLVSVVQPFLGFGDRHDAELTAHQQQSVSSAIRSAANQLKGASPHVRTHVLDHRHIGEGLVEFAEEESCDMVVVGETGRSGVSRLLLGSVSRYVLRHAPCSVWITRNRAVSGTSKGAAHHAKV